MSHSGGYFVHGEEEQKLRQYLFSNGIACEAEQGKSATWIEREAGLNIPARTESLIVELDAVGEHAPLSREKMMPVMGYIAVEGVEDAIRSALIMLDLVDKGHSAGHS